MDIFGFVLASIATIGLTTMSIMLAMSSDPFAGILVYLTTGIAAYATYWLARYGKEA